MGVPRVRWMPSLLLLAAMAVATASSAWSWAQEEGGRETRHEAESEQPAPMNWTDFGGRAPPFLAMLVNFALLAGGYYLFGKKPIAAALQVRRDSIAKDIEEAARMRIEAEERAKKYQAKLESLEKEVALAREALVRAGEAERERIVREAEAKAERMRKDAVFLVEQELKQMRLDLWREAVDAAVLAAEELLKSRITAEDHGRLAEDFLAGLEIERRGVPGEQTTAGGAGARTGGAA
jgi:F-type H+-transporting ATPase subunit b